MLFATLIWGTSFVIMKDTLDNVKPLFLLSVRFFIGAAVLFLVCIPRLKKLDKVYIGSGILMGIFLGLAYILQTYGLSHTTPGKNAFLTAVYCIIVPFLYWITDKKKPDIYNIIAAVFCFAGVGMLSLSAGSIGGASIGDLLTLCGGTMYALHIVVVRHASEKREDMLLLTCIQFTVSALLCIAGTLIFEGKPVMPSGRSLYSLLYLGLMATTLALFLQNWGQKLVPPSPAAVILSFEALFGAAISLALGYDEPKPRLFIGFVLMFVAIIISEVKPFSKKEKL